jgi:hypothetical protein
MSKRLGVGDGGTGVGSSGVGVAVVVGEVAGITVSSGVSEMTAFVVVTEPVTEPQLATNQIRITQRKHLTVGCICSFRSRG